MYLVLDICTVHVAHASSSCRLLGKLWPLRRIRREASTWTPSSFDSPRNKSASTTLSILTAASRCPDRGSSEGTQPVNRHDTRLTALTALMGLGYLALCVEA